MEEAAKKKLLPQTEANDLQIPLMPTLMSFDLRS